MKLFSFRHIVPSKFVSHIYLSFWIESLGSTCYVLIWAVMYVSDDVVCWLITMCSDWLLRSHMTRCCAVIGWSVLCCVAAACDSDQLATMAAAVPEPWPCDMPVLAGASRSQSWHGHSQLTCCSGPAHTQTHRSPYTKTHSNNSGCNTWTKGKSPFLCIQSSVNCSLILGDWKLKATAPFCLRRDVGLLPLHHLSPSSSASPTASKLFHFLSYSNMITVVAGCLT